MTAFTGDIQILLYTEEVDFSACRDFYQTLLGQEPYYSWDEGTQDRGAKFRAGRGTISVLCQAHDRKTGPVIVNLETGQLISGLLLSVNLAFSRFFLHFPGTVPIIFSIHPVAVPSGLCLIWVPDNRGVY